MDSRSRLRQNQLQHVTHEMIEAGIRALHESIGFQHEGDPEEAVIEVFRAMSASRRTELQTRR